MKKNWCLQSRLLSFLLAMVMLFSIAVPANSAGEEGSKVRITKVNNGEVSASLLDETSDELPEEPGYHDTDVVRVSIVLEKASTIGAGYSTRDIAKNNAAMAYRANLEREQVSMTQKIERAIGEELDVVWNLTLAANIISANVEYGQIEEIENISGVKEVYVEPVYELLDTPVEGSDVPNMMISSVMTGSNIAWQEGYTGAGTRIAIVDSGVDLDHQSFDGEALEYALREDAEKAGMSYEDYLEKIDLLDKEELAEVLPQLHIAERLPDLSAEDLYRSTKAPLTFNYNLKNLAVSHVGDTASEHGSHVAGIASANRYIPDGDNGFVSSAESVYVVGNAPDAQILAMKVVSPGGGVSESDYMVAVEDAILLDCDSINISIGSQNAGVTLSPNFQYVMEELEQTDTVLCLSAGNSYYWAYKNFYLASNTQYIENPNFATGGSPGTYANSLTVASVDNDGGIGVFNEVNGYRFFYDENLYKNEPMAGMDTNDGDGTDYEYVFLDGYGLPEDYEGIDVKDKIVLVSRGGITFPEKANNAVEAGAVATMIYNNEPGSLGIILTGYTYDKPCVSITQVVGGMIRKNSTEQKTEDGRTYLTGTMTINSEIQIGKSDSPYYTMSAFSSWGVPSDLTLKPEITAPGGSIYSVNGAHGEEDDEGNLVVRGGPTAYELMSGTSMAAPQITGISALVQQYIRESGISQKDMTDRALTQSLIMSTATPLKDADGRYYPVIQQGAGLVDTAAATSADSYVTVTGQPDGKVKAELFDDPVRVGVYSFTFQLNNLTDQEKAYNLRADVFTQDKYLGYLNADAAENEDQDQTTWFLSTSTTNLDANVVWFVAGEHTLNYDINRDGHTDIQDAQALLDYVTGVKEAAEINIDIADMNGDGAVTSYDAHALLKKLDTGSAVTVPANGSTEITVTINLPDAVKRELDQYYTGGAYIEAYIFADAAGDAEGVQGTSHAIPMLAFYGSWTDGPMFEVGSYPEYAAGCQPKSPYFYEDTNCLFISYADKPGKTFYFGGNPLVTDSKYMPERDAMNSANEVYQLQYSAIRNYGASRTRITGADGEKLKEITVVKPTPGAYPSGSSWGAYSYNSRLNWKPSNLDEGDQFWASITLAPELNVNYETGEVDWDALHDGATLHLPPVTIDNTAPEIIGTPRLNEDESKLIVTAKDNQYVSAVVLYNATGTQPQVFTGAVQTADPGQAYTYTLDLSKAQGQKFLLQVTDYAMNTATYRLEIDISAPPPLPDMLALNTETREWIGFGRDTDPAKATLMAHADRVFTGAAEVGGRMYACSEDSELFVIDTNVACDFTYVAPLSVIVDDMAYDAETQTLYGVADNTLVRIDMDDGSLEVIGKIGIPATTLAYDGTYFYSVYYGSFSDGYKFPSSGYEYGCVCRYTLEDIQKGTMPQRVTNELANVLSYSGEPVNSVNNKGRQALEVDPNTGKMYWNSYNTGILRPEAYLFEIDLTAEPTEDGYYPMTRLADFGSAISCLCIPDKDGAAYNPGEATEVKEVKLSQTELNLKINTTAQLKATVLPWTLPEDQRAMIWSSSDATVATVTDDGLVTALAEGECDITAASETDSTKTATCHVQVEIVDVTLTGILQEKGTVKTFTWDMKQEAWETEKTIEVPSFISSTYDEENGVLYINENGENGGMIHKVDMETGKILESAVNGTGQPLMDMACSIYLDDIVADQRIVAINNGCYFYKPQNAMQMNPSDYNFMDSVANVLTAVTSAGYESVGKYIKYDTEHFIMLANDGQVCNNWLYWNTDHSGFYYDSINAYPSDLKLSFPGDGGALYCSMVLGNDNALYLSYFNGSGTDIYRLIFNQGTQRYESEMLGTMGGTYPVSLHSATNNDSHNPGEAGKVEEVKLSQTKLNLRVNATAQLTAFVLPVDLAEDQCAVTWSSSDETVATVTDDGLVTALAEGECDITVVSVTDPTKTATCHVTVKSVNAESVDVTLTGILQEADGTVKTFSWNMLEAGWKTGKAINVGPFTSSTYDEENGILYVNENGDNGGFMRKVNMETGDVLASTDYSTGYQYDCMEDMACCTYLDNEVQEQWIVGINKGYRFYRPQDFMNLDTGNYSLMLSLTDQLVAVTSAGYKEIGSYIKYDAEHFIMLDNEGGLINEWLYWETDMSGLTYDYFGRNSYPSDLELSFPEEDGNHYCSMVLGNDNALYLSYFNGSGTDIYRLIFNQDTQRYESEMLGTMGGAYPVSLHSATNNDSDDLNALPMPNEAAFVEEPMDVNEDITSGKSVNPEGNLIDRAVGCASVPGRLQSVTEANTGKSENRAMAAAPVIDIDTKTVTLNLTADEAVSNGLITVNYDASELTLINLDGMAELNSFHKNEDGLVTFGYAYKETVPVGTTLATLTFTFKSAKTAKFTVTTLERNEKTLEVIQIVELPLHEHVPELRNQKEATCTEDGYTGDVYCTICGELLQEGEVIPALGHKWGDWIVTKQSDCFHDGEETRTCPVCRETETRVIPASSEACPTKKFVDLNPALWYHEGVDYVLQSGLMIGTSKTTFSPNGLLTRGQLMVILYRLAGTPEVKAKASFTDAANAYYTDAVAWAYEAGIAKGVSETRFAPNAAANREQLATFFARYAVWSGHTVEAEGDLSGYKDAGRVSAYAKEAMLWAVESGLIKGTGENTLSPQNNATRAQAAMVLLRYCTALTFESAE